MVIGAGFRVFGCGVFGVGDGICYGFYGSHWHTATPPFLRAWTTAICLDSARHNCGRAWRLAKKSRIFLRVPYSDYSSISIP